MNRFVSPSNRNNLKQFDKFEYFQILEKYICMVFKHSWSTKKSNGSKAFRCTTWKVIRRFHWAVYLQLVFNVMQISLILLDYFIAVLCFFLFRSKANSKKMMMDQLKKSGLDFNRSTDSTILNCVLMKMHNTIRTPQRLPITSSNPNLSKGSPKYLKR